MQLLFEAVAPVSEDPYMNVDRPEDSLLAASCWASGAAELQKIYNPKGGISQEVSKAVKKATSASNFCPADYVTFTAIDTANLRDEGSGTVRRITPQSNPRDDLGNAISAALVTSNSTVRGVRGVPQPCQGAGCDTSQPLSYFFVTLGLASLGAVNVNAFLQFANLDFAMVFSYQGGVSIFENGQNLGQVGTYTPGVSTFEVAISAAGRVEYRVNGTLVYTSLKNPVYPLEYAVTELWTTNDTVKNSQWVVNPAPCEVPQPCEDDEQSSGEAAPPCRDEDPGDTSRLYLESSLSTNHQLAAAAALIAIAAAGLFIVARRTSQFSWRAESQIATAAGGCPSPEAASLLDELPS